MKHTLRITLILLCLFLLTQIVGLITVNQYIGVKDVNGTKVIEHGTTIIGEPPVIEDKTFTFISIVIAILIGTGILFLLIKFRLGRLWKYWFLLSVWITMGVSFNVYITSIAAIILAGVLAFLKIYSKNIFIHNLTEIFIYTGISIIILPFLNLFSAFALLIAISLYDAYAVWKSKHMITLAKFQTKNKLFAGLYIPYERPPKQDKKMVKPEKIVMEKSNNAILGGGDMAFPLLFSSAVMEHLILVNNISKTFALLETFIIAATSGIALFFLFLAGKKDRFYPAMPFISLGCFVGLGIIFLINL